MPSNRLIFHCPLLLPPSIFPSIRVFSNESVLHIRSAITSLNNVSPPFFSFWDPDNVCILVFMMVSHKFFKFSSLHFILFSFCSSGRITLPCLQVYWSFLHVIWSAVKCLCWIFQFNYYILQLYDLFLFTFTVSSWNSHSVHTLFFWLWWASLWPLFWILYQVNHLPQFIKICFWLLVVLLFGTFLCFFHYLDTLCLFLCTEWRSYPSQTLWPCVGDPSYFLTLP